MTFLAFELVEASHLLSRYILKVLPDSRKDIRLDLGMINGYLGTKDSLRSFGSLPVIPHLSTFTKLSPANESPTQRTS